MAKGSELESAFAAAIAQTRKYLKTGMTTVTGQEANAHLERLEQELTLQRASVLEGGTLDREWFQKTLRWLVEWVPETEPQLIAALGRIARSVPSK